MSKKPILGLKELERALVKELPKKILDNVKVQIAKSADALVADLKARVPVYTGPDTSRSDGSEIVKGALRDSIGWTFGTPPSGSLKLASVRNKRLGLRLTVYAGNDIAFYARWVEHGTANWEGSPFFYGTYRDHRARIRSGITRAINKAIKELAFG